MRSCTRYWRSAALGAATLGYLVMLGGCDPKEPKSCSDDAYLELDPACFKTAHTDFRRGLVYFLDGEEYFLDGPLENEARDIPGSYWHVVDEDHVVGYMVNTGPFGLPSWWSSDAGDGALLYYVVGTIDIWSPEKAAWYRSQGYSHYHEFVSVAHRMMHPSKVMWLKHQAVSAFTLDRGSQPWYAHEVSPGVDHEYIPNTQYPYPPHEKFLYVGCVDVGGEDPDFLAVIGTDPDDPATYSKIIHRMDMPDIGDEVHHYGYNVFQTRLLVPGLFSGRLHIVNVEDDPRHPYVESYHDDLTPDSGYIVPHTVIGMPDGGYLLSMIGSASPDSASGGLVRLDAEGRFVEPFGPPAQRTPADTPPRYMYDLGINRIRNRMITTSFGLPADIADGITLDGLGNHIYVWDYAAREVIQVVDTGPQSGPLEVRWLSDPGSTIGFTNAPGTSEIWRWHDLDLDGHYEFEVAIRLPPMSVPTDILLSSDDRFLYVASWVGNNVRQYDISDPFRPELVAEVTIPHAQMMRLSPHNDRLYVTNSLLSTWDDTPFPPGVTRNSGYGMYLIDINPHDGGMTLNPDFFVDFDHVQKKSSVGKARPHQVFFDPDVRRHFGDH